MDFPHALLVTALCIQIYNTGTIWFAQVVVYPLFAKVGAADYVGYHGAYTARIPLPVIAPGFASFLVPLALPFAPLPGVPGWMAWGVAALSLIGLAVTVLLEIPRHNRLERHGKDDRLIAELIRYNWPRTAAITASAALLLAMCGHAFAPV